LVLEDFDTGEVRTTDRGGPSHEFIARVAAAFKRLLGDMRRERLRRSHVGGARGSAG
jgi:hypothetical protein